MHEVEIFLNNIKHEHFIRTVTSVTVQTLQESMSSFLLGHRWAWSWFSQRKPLAIEMIDAGHLRPIAYCTSTSDNWYSQLILWVSSVTTPPYTSWTVEYVGWSCVLYCFMLSSLATCILLFCSVPWKPTYKAPHYIAATHFLSTTHVNRIADHILSGIASSALLSSLCTHTSEQRWKIGSDSAMQGDTLAAEESGSTSVEQCLSAKFHFVDLAGSERAGRTGNQGERFKGQPGHWLLCFWTSGQQLIRVWSLKDVSSCVPLLPLCNIFTTISLLWNA